MHTFFFWFVFSCKIAAAQLRTQILFKSSSVAFFSVARTVPERTLFLVSSNMFIRYLPAYAFPSFFIFSCFCSTFVVSGCLVTKTPAVTATPITASIMTAIPIFFIRCLTFYQVYFLIFPTKYPHKTDTWKVFLLLSLFLRDTI